MTTETGNFTAQTLTTCFLGVAAMLGGLLVIDMQTSQSADKNKVVNMSAEVKNPHGECARLEDHYKRPDIKKEFKESGLQRADLFYNLTTNQKCYVYSPNFAGKK